MSTSVCHIASNHPRTDVRIFVKEISSLKEAGFDVSLVVADGMKDDERNKIFDAGKVSGRFRRLLLLRKLYKKAAALQCELYHFHDPELIPVAFRLKKDGKKVIYDIHEDLPRQLLSKPYIPAVFRKPLSRLLEKYENRRSKKFDALLTSTDHIKSRFSTFHPRVEAVKNYPRIEEFRETGTTARDEGTFSLLYIGALMEVRGVREMLQAVSGLPVTLNIAGFFPEKSFEEEILRDPLWSGVRYHGYLNREGIRGLLASCDAGLVLLHPTLNYRVALPVKMFEYMVSGLPFIASDFPQWEAIVREEDCGICVNPQDVGAIKKAIEYLYNNPDIAARMGNNGREAVLKKYHWEQEAKKLLSVYHGLLT